MSSPLYLVGCMWKSVSLSSPASHPIACSFCPREFLSSLQSMGDFQGLNYWSDRQLFTECSNETGPDNSALIVFFWGRKCILRRVWRVKRMSFLGCNVSVLIGIGGFWDSLGTFEPVCGIWHLMWRPTCSDSCIKRTFEMRQRSDAQSNCRKSLYFLT